MWTAQDNKALDKALNTLMVAFLLPEALLFVATVSFWATSPFPRCPFVPRPLLIQRSKRFVAGQEDAENPPAAVLRA